MFRHMFDVGTMLRVFELNVKNLAFAQQKNSSNAKGFLLRTTWIDLIKDQLFSVWWIDIKSNRQPNL